MMNDLIKVNYRTVASFLEVNQCFGSRNQSRRKTIKNWRIVFAYVIREVFELLFFLYKIPYSKAERRLKKLRKLTAVSLFSGAGGLDMGFERAGFKIIWANDSDADACRTHENWSDAKVVCGDIAKIMDIPDADIILGGFP